MIRREQLVAAIRRIEAPERELLWLSLRRRVPDSALARLYACEPAEVARRRAAAIERVADEVGVQRGEDFGAVLTGLLEAEIWQAAAPETTIPAPPPEFPPERPAERELAPPPVQAEQPPAVPPPASPRPRSRQRRGPLRWALAVALAIGIAVAGVVVASDGSGGHPRKGAATFTPRREAPAARPSGDAGVPCYFTASVAHATELYRHPGGPSRARISARTRWGSPRVLHVVVRRAAWLGVIAPELRNRELGWLPVQAASVGCVAWSLDADLSHGRLEVRRGGRLVRTIRVAVGPRGRRPPPGRFSVTDRLQVSGRSPYGCCVLALSGHQGRRARRGGDRLAVYAQTASRARANALSTGALRAPSDDARWLIDNIPLGTPIFIRD